MRTLPLLLIPLVLVLIAGCQPNTADQGGDKEYDIRGKIVAVDPTKQTVTLDHESIPGVMSAMTMPFKVEDAKLLAGLQAGDSVQGKLKRSDAGLVITRLDKR